MIVDWSIDCPSASDGSIIGITPVGPGSNSDTTEGGRVDMRPVGSSQVLPLPTVVQSNGVDHRTAEEIDRSTAELASLIFGNGLGYLYFRKNGPEDIKELSRSFVKDISQVRNERRTDVHSILLSGKEVGFSSRGSIRNHKTSDVDHLDGFLDLDLDGMIFSRIHELLSDELISAKLRSEMESRKDNLSFFKTSIQDLQKINSLNASIKNAKRRILGMKVEAFKKGRRLNVKEIAYVDGIRRKIDKAEKEIEKLKGYREVATVFRFQELSEYKKQLDETGFVKSPSRQKLIEEIEDSILLGKSVLLTGPTGTGKTVMAVEAVKEIAFAMNIGYEDISGSRLAEEAKDPEMISKLDDFIEIFSGTPDAKASDFIVKQRLRAGANGGTETYSELGKILKAFTQGKIPIMDEIDLVPNPVLMRIKHLFTLKQGQEYSPQEDGNQRHKLITVNLIATANIKSDKHQDREDLDPAIVRLFDNIHVNYLPEEEVYDLAIVNLMDKEGFIYKVGFKDVGDKESVLVRLVSSLKMVEENYLGTGCGMTISGKDGQFLRKAILELGKFVGIFSGFHVSGSDLGEYLKEEIINFATNMAYPKSDRLVLIKIFSIKGFITKEDTENLKTIMGDVSESDLHNNIMSDDHEFKKESKIFIDPYELANLDPYGKRKLHELKMKSVPSPAFDLLKEIDRYLGKRKDLSDKEEFEMLIGKILEEAESDPSYRLNEENKKNIVYHLYKLKLKDYIKKLYELEIFKEMILKLMMFELAKMKPEDRMFPDFNGVTD